jgi:serine/threonine protein kinase
MELATGVVVDGLRLVAPLGAGAMGSVWSAQDEKLGRLVAVKFIAPGGAIHESALPRFQREATLIAKLKSPHVVQIFGHGVAGDGTPYIEMEMLEGKTLLETISGTGPLPLGRAAEILDQLARALTAAHALGIVHRDIKPSNLFLIDAAGYDVFVKVVDFGIAREVDGEDVTLTKAGSVIGTPLYMSAEQLTGTGTVDKRSDLWAAAVVTYEMIVGQTPFQGTNAAALAVAVERGVFPAPSQVVSNLPPAIDAWFEKALARDPADRFASAEEMARSFRRVVDAAALGDAPTVEQPLARSATSGSGPVAPQPRSRFGGLAPIAGVVAGGLVVFLATRRTESPAAASASSSASVAPIAEASAASSSDVIPPPRVDRRPAEGRLPPELIQSVIRARMSAIRRCTDQLGQLILRRTVYFTIGTDGRAQNVQLAELDGRAPDVDRCIIEKFSALAFAKPEGGSIDVVYPVAFNPHGLLVDDASCASSDACLATGQCSAVGDTCRAKTDGDCELSLACTERGECSAVKGRCIARYTECGSTAVACTKFGLCTSKDGRCVATSDQACAASEGCERFGLCAHQDGACRATSDQMCAPSWACKGSGQCGRRNFGCRALTDASCRASADCRDSGMCTAHAGRCIAKADADCKAAKVCRERGSCSAGVYGRCVAKTTEDCKRSTRCKELGLCRLDNYTCEAE